LLELHRDHFIEMVNQSYELTQALVGAMSDRVRDFTQLRSQNEKLISLGKISAGLAHELNNPAAAMVRSAAELHRRQHQTPERFKAVMTMRVTDEQTDAVNAILFSKIQHVKGVELSLMEREARKDDLLDWLDSHDIPDSEELAETLVEFDFTEADLLEINKIVNGQHLKAIIRWIEGTLSLERLVHEIRESASRIATLVQSVKSYSHMDRGTGMEPVPVQEGIRSTLVMLQHKIKQKRIQVIKNFSPNLPDAQGYPGEINQVWTNLIDNAIDAMPEEGTLTITTHHDPHFVNVAIHDTGAGIPEELQTLIFDPFFTTKPMGQGTGLGLDVVNKIIFHHRGDIRVESQPGSTTFTVALPINGASSA
ncbi:MAG TPA: ATP-binding protein, partial [Saprospiraceae bacterium]|nr:ATP-binding protein [Saprospiraceae bacterium]